MIRVAEWLLVDQSGEKSDSLAYHVRIKLFTGQKQYLFCFLSRSASGYGGKQCVDIFPLGELLDCFPSLLSLSHAIRHISGSLMRIKQLLGLRLKWLAHGLAPVERVLYLLPWLWFLQGVYREKQVLLILCQGGPMDARCGTVILVDHR